MNDSPLFQRISQSRQTHERENFQPQEILENFLARLSVREQEVLRRRFCFVPKSSSQKETLEDIGKSMKVTRERVRQIEKEAIQKMKELDKNLGKDSPLRVFDRLISATLSEHGGVMEENHLIETLHQSILSSGIYHQIIRFVIHYLLKERLEPVEENEHVHSAWKLPFESLDFFHSTHREVCDYIEKEFKPMLLDELYKNIQERVSAIQSEKKISEDILHAHLRMSKRIKKNVFGEWGFAHWPTIAPRHMNDKIYLVLKRVEKPMHFREIAESINNANFDHKRAFPATIHNELILDEKYVLVGKGIYALREWGYTAGTVIDVIQEILHEHGSLLKEVIVKKVLEKRMVKRTTIQLVLMDKENFFKHPETGEYSLVSP